MVSSRKIVYAVVDAVMLGDKIKPVQEAVRRVFYRYGLTDEVLFNRFSGLVYNVFKNYGLAEYIVEKITGLNPRRKDPLVRSVFRVAGYVFQLDPIIDNKWKHRFHKYLCSYVEKKLGQRGRRICELIGKLREVKWEPRSETEELMVKYRIHPGLYKLLEKSFNRLNEDLESFLLTTLKPRIHVFRVNMLKATRKAILNYLGSMGYKVEPGKYSEQAIRLEGSLTSEVLRLIETGVLTPQDEASMVAVEILPLHENIVVADLCAAPGNKTSYLAERLKLRVTIHAFDINKDRIKRMRRLLERTGTLDVVKIYNMDARKSIKVLGPESMDLVLVDPPCSSTGALARNPEVRWRYTPKALEKINDLQRELLDTAVKLVKSGGHILYTVCSVLVSEGEYVVMDILDKYGDILSIVPLTKPFKESPLLPGTMRSYPHIHGVTGFYYALLRKQRGLSE